MLKAHKELDGQARSQSVRCAFTIGRWLPAVATRRRRDTENERQSQLGLTSLCIIIRRPSPDFVSYARSQREARCMESTALATSSRTSWENDITEISEPTPRATTIERIMILWKVMPGLYGAKHTELLVNGSSAGLHGIDNR